MSSLLRLPALFVLTMVAQRLLGLPGTWPFAMALMLPAPWIVGPPLLSSERSAYRYSFLIGLTWDILFEPVIGPGAIAWSAAALMAWVYSGFVADRSPRSWFVLGALSTLTIAGVRALAFAPLGVSALVTWNWLFLSMLFTGLWCGGIGLILAADLPYRWRRFRARKLR